MIFTLLNGYFLIPTHYLKTRRQNQNLFFSNRSVTVGRDAAARNAGSLSVVLFRGVRTARRAVPTFPARRR